MTHVRIILLALAVPLMLVGYTNCGQETPGGAHYNASAASLPSYCEQDLQSAFNTSYRPFVTSSNLCISCHNDHGTAGIDFASQTLATGFAAFMSVGADRVDTNAVSTTHAPPRTGPSNQTSITAARAIWNPAYATYQQCLTAGNQTSGSLTMDAKNSPDLYFGDGRKVTLSWVLSNEAQPSSSRIPAIFTLDVKVNYVTNAQGKTPVGYAFTNPRMHMLTGETEVDIEGLVIKVNDTQPSGTEPFLSSKKTVRGVDDTIFFNGDLNISLAQVSSGDKLSLGFGYLNAHARTDNPPVPAKPTVAPKNPFTNTLSVPLNISGDSTARRWCLTYSSARPTSTSVPCPGFESDQTTDGWLTTRPAALDLTKLGRVPNSNEQIQFYLWVANSDLKISADAGLSQLTFDTTLPTAPAFGSVALNDTQIASIVGLGDSGEPVSWCVKETAIMADSQKSDGCAFSSTKPQYIGLAGSGVRFVTIFVMDRAGNQSRSQTQSVNNTFGRVTLEQLTSSTTGARGVFYNQCNSCHGTGGAQNSVWNSTDYAQTVAKKSTILSRITNAASPMPTSGLLGDKDRMLIQLWFSQSSTPVQQ